MASLAGERRICRHRCLGGTPGRRDPGHPDARRYFRDLPRGTRLVTSNLVIGESATWLIYHGYRRQALALHDRTRSAERAGFLEIAWVSREVQGAAWALIEQYGDQVFSFADCTSAVIARQVKADYIVGFDRDFSIMGFELRP